MAALADEQGALAGHRAREDQSRLGRARSTVTQATTWS